MNKIDRILDISKILLIKVLILLPNIIAGISLPGCCSQKLLFIG